MSLNFLKIKRFIFFAGGFVAATVGEKALIFSTLFLILLKRSIKSSLENQCKLIDYF